MAWSHVMKYKMYLILYINLLLCAVNNLNLTLDSLSLLY